MSNPRERAIELRETMRCNCDLDNWEPVESTGHESNCRIHRAAHRLAEYVPPVLSAEDRAYDAYVTSPGRHSDEEEPETPLLITERNHEAMRLLHGSPPKKSKVDAILFPLAMALIVAIEVALVLLAVFGGRSR